MNAGQFIRSACSSTKSNMSPAQMNAVNQMVCNATITANPRSFLSTVPWLKIIIISKHFTSIKKRQLHCTLWTFNDEWRDRNGPEAHYVRLRMFNLQRFCYDEVFVAALFNRSHWRFTCICLFYTPYNIYNTLWNKTQDSVNTLISILTLQIPRLITSTGLLISNSTAVNATWLSY